MTADRPTDLCAQVIANGQQTVTLTSNCTDLIVLLVSRMLRKQNAYKNLQKRLSRWAIKTRIRTVAGSDLCFKEMLEKSNESSLRGISVLVGISGGRPKRNEGYCRPPYRCH